MCEENKYTKQNVVSRKGLLEPQNRMISLQKSKFTHEGKEGHR